MNQRAKVRTTVLVVVGYALCYVLGQYAFQHVYTVGWTSQRIVWFFAPVTTLVVWLAPRASGWWSFAGYPVGALLGELIGRPIYDRQIAALQSQLDAGRAQDWNPAHPGWLIASAVFLAATGIGWAVERRRARCLPAVSDGSRRAAG